MSCRTTGLDPQSPQCHGDQREVEGEEGRLSSLRQQKGNSQVQSMKLEWRLAFKKILGRREGGSGMENTCKFMSDSGQCIEKKKKKFYHLNTLKTINK